MSTPSPAVFGPPIVHRKDFPSDFAFGAATSAFQIEGALDEFGRGPSIWDTFAEERGLYGDLDPNKAVGHYYHYKDDLNILKNMGFDSYRFSISWTRIVPTGKVKDGVNPEGIAFYNSLINELRAKGIEPFVTLLHFDPPQALEDEYLGFLDPLIADDFRDYTDVCFREFGDRVRYWITINEAHSFVQNGYATGVLAPGRGGFEDQDIDAVNNDFLPSFLPPAPNSTAEATARTIETLSHILPPDPFASPEVVARTIEARRQSRSPIIGDPGVEPYQAAHHKILAHAKAVALYREKYQPSQLGVIGITNVSPWYEPLTDSEKDREAALRAMDFYYGWFIEPLVTGDYPARMREFVKERLPVFSEQEADMIKGSYDFLGVNYYTARFVSDAIKEMAGRPPHYIYDQKCEFHTERDGVLIGPQGKGSSWMFVYPRGLFELLRYTKNVYNNPTIYITENGTDESDEPSKPLGVALHDTHRLSYIRNHLYYLREAMNLEKVNVRGYFAWSLLDNFEWAYGFTVRFGLNFIDYRNGSPRIPKFTASWMRWFLTNK